jgi:hypothetical protein
LGVMVRETWSAQVRDSAIDISRKVH